MPDLGPIRSEHASLADALDHLLNKGVVLTGDAMLSLAGIDLVYVGLNLVISSVETLREQTLRPPPPAPPPLRDGGEPDSLSLPTQAANRRTDANAGLGGTPGRSSPPSRSGGGVGGGGRLAPATPALPPSSMPLYPDSETVDVDQPPPGAAPAASEPAEGPEQGLARLVLTLIELLRQILERQALRRAEGGGLSDEEVERMGVALMDLEAKMAELRDVFGLSEEDLNLDLGPLGRLL